jgi:hypothetical protein
MRTLILLAILIVLGISACGQDKKEEPSPAIAFDRSAGVELPDPAQLKLDEKFRRLNTAAELAAQTRVCGQADLSGRLVEMLASEMGLSRDYFDKSRDEILDEPPAGPLKKAWESFHAGLVVGSPPTSESCVKAERESQLVLAKFGRQTDARFETAGVFCRPAPVWEPPVIGVPAPDKVSPEAQSLEGALGASVSNGVFRTVPRSDEEPDASRRGQNPLVLTPHFIFILTDLADEADDQFLYYRLLPDLEWVAGNVKRKALTYEFEVRPPLHIFQPASPAQYVSIDRATLAGSWSSLSQHRLACQLVAPSTLRKWVTDTRTTALGNRVF